MAKAPSLGGKSRSGKRMGFGKKEAGFGAKLGRGKKGKLNMEGPHK